VIPSRRQVDDRRSPRSRHDRLAVLAALSLAAPASDRLVLACLTVVVLAGLAVAAAVSSEGDEPAAP
jgi:hypothetical protein